MKKVFLIFLSSIAITVQADDLGKATYQALCQDCHSPQFSKAMHAPTAFDKKAWDERFKKAEIEAKNNPNQFKTAMDYLLYKTHIGKGLMPHKGLCIEANIPNKNCSDAALIQAIQYMSGH